MRRWRISIPRVAAALASGVMVAAAFPPFNSSDAAWMGFIPLLVMLRFTPPREALRWGFLSGLTTWLIVLGWLLNMGKTGGSWLEAGAAWVALSAYCALYTAGFSGLVAAFWSPDRERDRAEAGGDASAREGLASWAWTPPLPLQNLMRLVAIPLVWAGFEYLRGALFTGFPWAGIGVSQYRNLALIQVAEVGGVPAVSAVVILMNTALALTGLDVVLYYARRGRGVRRVHVELMVGLALWSAVWIWGLKRVRATDRVTAAGEEIVIGIIQANIPQTVKWDENVAPDTLDTMVELTRQILTPRLNLVIWPETAVAYDVRRDDGVRQALEPVFAAGVPLLTGSIDVDPDAEPVRYYNASVLFGPGGDILSVYRKKHLVLFGEYIPMETWFPWLSQFAPLGYSCTPGVESTVFALPRAGVRFGALICFEDVFPELSREVVNAGARMLVNQTNDAWFDRSNAAAVQHLAHSVMRAVENRVPVVRCANEGVSCVIDASGRIDRVAAGEIDRGVATLTQFRVEPVRVPPGGGAGSLYTRAGDRLFGLPCGIGVLAGLVVVFRRRPGVRA